MNVTILIPRNQSAWETLPLNRLLQLLYADDGGVDDDDETVDCGSLGDSGSRLLRRRRRRPEVDATTTTTTTTTAVNTLCRSVNVLGIRFFDHDNFWRRLRPILSKLSSTSNSSSADDAEQWALITILLSQFHSFSFPVIVTNNHNRNDRHRSRRHRSSEDDADDGGDTNLEKANDETSDRNNNRRSPVEISDGAAYDGNARSALQKRNTVEKVWDVSTFRSDNYPNQFDSITTTDMNQPSQTPKLNPITSITANIQQRQRHHYLILLNPPSLPPPKQQQLCLRPERTFTSLLVQLENLQLRLQTLNAFFATLGGGYFLCHHLSTAIQLARSQRSVALALGDRSGADRCTLNEAYNYVHSGRLGVAVGLIWGVWKRGRERGDDAVCGLSVVALRFAVRVGKVAGLLLEDGGDSDCWGRPSLGCLAKSLTNVTSFLPRSKVSATCDDYQRIRIVPDRTGKIANNNNRT